MVGTLVATRSEIVRIGGANYTVAIPYQIAELVVNVRTGMICLVRSDKDIALREVSLYCDIKNWCCGLWSL